MAQKVQIVLEDDLAGDGSPADETVTFGLDGTTYEIDLNDKNAKGLRKALDMYVAHARKVTGGKGRTAKKSTSSKADGPAPADIRAWAKENGHEVPERGRIPANVREAYEAAN